MTFNDLKTKIDQMTPEQLAAPAIWWGDERGGEIQRVDILEEDYLRVDDGLEPRSAYNGEDITEDSVAVKAGTPVLIAD